MSTTTSTILNPTHFPEHGTLLFPNSTDRDLRLRVMGVNTSPHSPSVLVMCEKPEATASNSDGALGATLTPPGGGLRKSEFLHLTLDLSRENFPCFISSDSRHDIALARDPKVPYPFAVVSKDELNDLAHSAANEPPRKSVGSI